MKSFKYKLFNNKQRSKKTRQELYVFCTIYNHTLALIKRHYKLFGKNPSKYDVQKHLTKLMRRGLKPKWKSVGYSQGIQDVTERIYKSYAAFFKWVKTRTGPKKSPPKFKPFRKYKSFTLKQAGWKINEENGRIKIGKTWYRYNNSRPIEGEIKTITVKRDPVGDWFVSLSCKVENIKSNKVMTGKIAGFDFGLKTFLTCSEDFQPDTNPEFLKQALKEVRKASRKVSQRKKGSRNRFKARINLARKHRKTSNQRLNYHFKTALSLVREYDYLFFEDLNLSGMKKLWGRKVSDLGFHQFMKIVEYMSAKHGKICHKINRFFPSSKTCSCCGTIKEDLSLKDRIFSCEKCGLIMDRDKNASINIKREGASSLGVGEVRLSLLEAISVDPRIPCL